MTAFDPRRSFKPRPGSGRMGKSRGAERPRGDRLSCPFIQLREKTMPTGRQVLAGVAAAAALMHTRFSIAKASQPTTAVNFDVPAGACDCHTHIHGDPAEYPWFAGRTYTPEMALPEEMAALHKAIHMQRVVIVTPSVYGGDNSATIYGMKVRGKGARGVAGNDGKKTQAGYANPPALGFQR